jgi:hypothetical protein
MTTTAYLVSLLVFTLFFANLPFISGRFFIFFTPSFVTRQDKPFWACFIEWPVYFFFVFLLSRGIERKVTGVIQEQQWEFIWVILLLFMVCSFPGFIYRYQIRKQLKRPHRKK